jgi:nucleotide-binding universal stress UspA family protein
LLRFGEMYATALAGDDHVARRSIMLTVGGELGGGAAPLRLTTLHLLNKLLSDELKFNVRIYVDEGVYNIAASGENAARFMHLLAVSAPSASGEYLNEKFDELVEEARVEVRFGNIRRTKRNVAADLTLSETGVAVKYNVYLRENKVELQFQSTNRGRVELAALLLRHAGVGAEVKKVGGGGVWQVRAATDVLAAGRKELREALAEIIKIARDNGWVEEKKARRWLEKLEKGMAAWEGKKFMVRLVEGALVVRFSSTSRKSVEDVVREFKAMGLVEGTHFTVKWSGGRGSVYLLAEGVRRLKWVSEHGEEGQRQRAAEFLKFLEARASAKGAEVLRKLEALVEEGRSRGALRLVGPERDGVKVLDVKTEEKDDKLYVTLRAEVDGAAGEYKITFYRERSGARRLMFYVKGEEAVARVVKLVEVLTGERPSVAERPDGLTRIGGAGRHIDALARYEELREAIERWSNR